MAGTKFDQKDMILEKALAKFFSQSKWLKAIGRGDIDVDLDDHLNGVRVSHKSLKELAAATIASLNRKLG